MARDAVAVETLARLAISRRSIFCLSERNGESQQTFANLHQSVYDFHAVKASRTRCLTVNWVIHGFGNGFSSWRTQPVSKRWIDGGTIRIGGECGSPQATRAHRRRIEEVCDSAGVGQYPGQSAIPE